GRLVRIPCESGPPACERRCRRGGTSPAAAPGVDGGRAVGEHLVVDRQQAQPFVSRLIAISQTLAAERKTSLRGCAAWAACSRWRLLTNHVDGRRHGLSARGEVGPEPQVR